MTDDKFKVWCGVETLDGEECVVVFDTGNWTLSPCYGPFVDDEEARTFIACGPHGLEDHQMCAKILPLKPPHSIVKPALLEV